MGAGHRNCLMQIKGIGRDAPIHEAGAAFLQPVGEDQVGFVLGVGTVDFDQVHANLYTIGLQYNF